MAALLFSDQAMSFLKHSNTSSPSSPPPPLSPPRIYHSTGPFQHPSCSLLPVGIYITNPLLVPLCAGAAPLDMDSLLSPSPSSILSLPLMSPRLVELFNSAIVDSEASLMTVQSSSTTLPSVVDNSIEVFQGSAPTATVASSSSSAIQCAPYSAGRFLYIKPDAAQLSLDVDAFKRNKQTVIDKDMGLSPFMYAISSVIETSSGIVGVFGPLNSAGQNSRSLMSSDNSEDYPLCHFISQPDQSPTKSTEINRGIQLGGLIWCVHLYIFIVFRLKSVYFAVF